MASVFILKTWFYTFMLHYRPENMSYFYWIRRPSSLDLMPQFCNLKKSVPHQGLSKALCSSFNHVPSELLYPCSPSKSSRMLKSASSFNIPGASTIKLFLHTHWLSMRACKKFRSPISISQVQSVYLAKTLWSVLTLTIYRTNYLLPAITETFASVSVLQEFLHDPLTPPCRHFSILFLLKLYKIMKLKHMLYVFLL